MLNIEFAGNYPERLKEWTISNIRQYEILIQNYAFLIEPCTIQHIVNNSSAPTSTKFSFYTEAIQFFYNLCLEHLTLNLKIEIVLETTKTLEGQSIAARVTGFRENSVYYLYTVQSCIASIIGIYFFDICISLDSSSRRGWDYPPRKKCLEVFAAHARAQKDQN